MVAIISHSLFLRILSRIVWPASITHSSNFHIYKYLSGLMKSEYFINSCLGNIIVAYGNVRTFEKIKQSLIDIEEHLSRIERTDELEPVVMEQLLKILELYQGLEK